MTATIAAYRPPFISQKRKEAPPYDDCAIESGLMLLGSWTLNEGLTQPDGDPKPLHDLSESLRRRIGDTSGGLTLAQVDQALHILDPDLPPLPRYPGQMPRPVPEATLELTWAQVRSRIIDDHAAIILGYQPGATVGHAIFVARGNDDGPIVMDPWLREPLGWRGERWTWKRLREFTEREVNGDRFGSDSAVACALVAIGSETVAARVDRAATRALGRMERALDSCRTARDLAQRELRDEQASHGLTRTALEACESLSLARQSELDQTRTRLADITSALAVAQAAEHRFRTLLDECEARQCDDCTDLARQLEAERDAAIERATTAEARLARAVEALTL